MEAVPFIGIDRHRLGVDGVGVTTLAAFHGCPLRCKYCLNHRCLESPEGLPCYTPQQLYDKVSIDNLYFIATGGGVCFGGGEPLLRTAFLVRFRALCGTSWRLTAESSLAVPRANVVKAAGVIDDFIVDIKDTNPSIYKAYTGRSNRGAMANLRWLLQNKGADHVTVRVPLIPQYNTDDDRDRSVAKLKEWGVKHIDRFDYVVRQSQPAWEGETKK